MVRKTRENTLIHGVDCKALGSRYASALMGDSQAAIADLPELQRHPVYRGLDGEKRAAVCANIKFAARDLLILAGHNPAIVENVFADK